MALDRNLKTLVTDRVDRDRVGRTSAILRLRLTLTVLATLLGIGWWAWAGGSRPTALYNPGHVTRHHAMFEQDCAKCHDGDGKGGFSKSVSDTACMACHDGAIHHPNQLTADNSGGLSRSKLVMAVSDPHRPAGNMSRSADCVACHTEHRDESALLASDDSKCTFCHADLGKAAKQTPAMQNRIVAFNPADHPDFGRRLMKVDPVDNKQRLFDPTVLKFDHRKHLSLAQLKNPDACISCHTTVNVPADPSHTDTPPFPSDRLVVDDRASGSGKYMQPVRYDRNCAGCHQLQLPDTVSSIELTVDGDKENKPVTPAISGVILRHGSLAGVRDQITAAVHAKMPTDPKGFVVPEADDTPDAIKALPPDQKWMRVNLMAMADDVSGAIGRRSLSFDASPMKLPDAPTAAQLTEAKLDDYYATQAVFSGKNACIACHDATGTLPSISSPAATPLATVSTGIPETPRHWYTASQFDHGRHQEMSCVECHATLSPANLDRIAAISDSAQQQAEARQVSDTSFVNSPGQTWTQWTSINGKFDSKTRSCAECHHSDTAAGRGAGDACVLCHQFHDRTKEVAVATVSPPAEAKGSP